jgi:hypothetical protein
MTAFTSLRRRQAAASLPETNNPAAPAQPPGRPSGHGVASAWYELELDTPRSPSALRMPTTRVLRGRGGETAPLRKTRQESERR